MPVTIEGLVTLYSWDIVVNERALESTPEQLFEAVRLADRVRKDKYYGYFGQWLTVQEYFQLRHEAEVAEATRAAKRKHTSSRRREFNLGRSRAVLLMIDAGIPYVCAQVGCNATDDLTVDHKVPLSRGGPDDLANLQFLCSSHNSTKGDKLNS